MDYQKRNNRKGCSCLNCDQPLYGRSDKKFCSPQCRYEFNNYVKKFNNTEKKIIEMTLLQNYDILDRLLSINRKSASRDELRALGFDIDYCTFTTVRTTHRVYRCFNIEYRITKLRVVCIHYIN